MRISDPVTPAAAPAPAETKPTAVENQVVAPKQAEAPEASEVRKKYDGDGYSAAPSGEPPAAKPPPMPQLSVADAVKISKEFGPQKLVQIQNLALLAQTKGITAPETLKALTELINDNKGSILKMIPGVSGLTDMAEAISGTDANGKQMSAGQRVWEFLKGLFKTAIAAPLYGAGSPLLAAMATGARVADTVNTAENLINWMPLLKELHEKGADPEVIDRLISVLQKKTTVERATESLRSNFVTEEPK